MHLSYIDWVATGTMLQAIGTFLGVLAVVWGARHAANTWKEQKRAERRLEMAERILTATHKAKSALSFVRGRMVWADELTNAEGRLKEEADWATYTSERRENRKMAQVIYDRLTTVKQDRAALADSIPLARALFNETLEESLQTLLRQFWLIQVDADAYGEDRSGMDLDFVQKVRRGIFDITPPDGGSNPLTATIDKAVSEIERICEPALRLDALNET